MSNQSAVSWRNDVASVRKIRLRCPQCRKTLLIPAKKTGQMIQCPACQTVLSVPTEQNTTHSEKSYPKPATGIEGSTRRPLITIPESSPQRPYWPKLIVVGVVILVFVCLGVAILNLVPSQKAPPPLTIAGFAGKWDHDANGWVKFQANGECQFRILVEQTVQGARLFGYLEREG